MFLNKKSNVTPCDWFSVPYIYIYIYIYFFVPNCLSNVINDMVKHYAHFSKVVMLFYALKNRALVIFCSMRPLVASGEKPKAFFPLNYAF